MSGQSPDGAPPVPTGSDAADDPNAGHGATPSPVGTPAMPPPGVAAPAGHVPPAMPEQRIPRLAAPAATAPSAPGSPRLAPPLASPEQKPGAPGSLASRFAGPGAEPSANPRSGVEAPRLAPETAPAGAAPAMPMGLGRAAPSQTPAPTPAAAPSEEKAGISGLGRRLPDSVDVGKVKIGESATDESAYKRASTEKKTEEGDLSLPEVLDVMVEMKASDLHLSAGASPTVRVNGVLRQLEDFPKLDSGMIQRVMYAAITQTQRETFEKNLELDFSYSLPGRGRFRVNLYRQRDSLGAAFRMIPYEIKSLEELGIPPAVREFANQPRGFVLVTGPTGSGKSTTLAALIDHANSTREEHIMTVEDPIEFLHRHKKCLVNQREVGADTWSFTDALKHVLRQDPDIILVGEMRDLETISVALTAAETGHLVFATLHTQDAAQTIDRVIDVFPPHQQQQVRQQLAGSLQGVVCQTLCKTKDGKGRVVATEVLVVTPAVRNLIREGKTHQIYSSMQAGAKHGMHTLDQHLAQLVREGKINYEVGVEKSHSLEDFNRLCGRG